MGWFAWPFEVAPNNNGMFSIAMAAGGEVSEIFAHGTGITAGNDDGGGFTYDTLSAGPFVPGQFYHVAATYTRGHLRLFWNGAFVTERAVIFGYAPISSQ